MDPLAHKYTYFQRLWHRWQARRDIPFRRKFFVGYDLSGNTYWEFTIDGNLNNLRRKLEPYIKSPFEVDHYHTVPPQWHQWLRRTRPNAPTIQELINDQLRQDRIKILAKQADQKWTLEKQKQQQALESQLQRELQKVQQRSAAANLTKDPKSVYSNDTGNSVENSNEKSIDETTAEKEQQATDPWKEADSQKSDMTAASVTPKR
ncbi:NADH-ubiquinone oxidoreductase assembly factor N7BML [Meyerozyma sp. JA9]|nr:NADH-ubiquinone oxidoreductase assembly factor N7BML [Meyerozyma sp. JA9]